MKMEPISIDFNVKILDIKGDPMKEVTEETRHLPPDERTFDEVDLKMVVVGALIKTLKTDKNEGRAKIKRTKLALKIEDVEPGALLELNVAQISTICKRVNDVYTNAVIVTRVWGIFNYGEED